MIPDPILPDTPETPGILPDSAETTEETEIDRAILHLSPRKRRSARRLLWLLAALLLCAIIVAVIF